MPELKFYYIKAPQHQEIKVDGAIGGAAPTGDRIYMSVYTERAALPQVLVHEVDENGALGDEIVSKREGKDGVVRSVQATLHLNIDQAAALRDWLGRQIDEVNKIQGN